MRVNGTREARRLIQFLASSFESLFSVCNSIAAARYLLCITTVFIIEYTEARVADDM